MESIINAPFMEEMRKATANMYRMGWDERNGGNISYMLENEDVEKYLELSTLGLIPNFDTVEKKKKSRRSKEEEEIHEPQMEVDEAIEVVDIEKEQEDAEH